MNQQSSGKKSYKPTVKFATNVENVDKTNASIEIKRTGVREPNSGDKEKLESNSKCTLIDSNPLNNRFAKLNTTIIVHKNESLISIENKSHSKARNPSPNKPLSFNNQLINEKKKEQRTMKNTENIEKQVVNNKEHLTFHQKRKLIQEKKAKFDQSLAILREKILIRKFAYIWLRVYYYKSKHTNKPIPSTAR